MVYTTKKSLLSLFMIFMVHSTYASQDPMVNSLSNILCSPAMQQAMTPIITALAAGIAKQIIDIQHGQNKTLNPFVWEVQQATELYGLSIAAGLQAAGASVHVKIPNEINLEKARAGFAPFMYVDCAPRSDKSLVGRTEADKKTVLSVRAGLSQNCKVEARCNLSNAVWAGCSVGALVLAQILFAAGNPQS